MMETAGEEKKQGNKPQTKPLTKNKMHQGVDGGETAELSMAKQKEGSLRPWGWQIWTSLGHKHSFTSPQHILLLNPEVNG